MKKWSALRWQKSILLRIDQRWGYGNVSTTRRVWEILLENLLLATVYESEAKESRVVKR